MSNATPTQTALAALEGVDALSIETLNGITELRFNSYENPRGVNTVVVTPAGKDPFTGEDTYNVRAYRAGRHFGEASRLRGAANAVFAVSLREVVESQVWS